MEILRERSPNARITFVPRDEDPRDCRVSFEKIVATLGFDVTMTVPEGIDEVTALVRSGVLEDPYAALYRN